MKLPFPFNLVIIENIPLHLNYLNLHTLQLPNSFSRHQRGPFGFKSISSSGFCLLRASFMSTSFYNSGGDLCLVFCFRVLLTNILFKNFIMKKDITLIALKTFKSWIATTQLIGGCDILKFPCQENSGVSLILFEFIRERGSRSMIYPFICSITLWIHIFVAN